jgi:hypothetical protein
MSNEEYHVHLYKIEGLCEMSIDANSQVDAQTKALQIADKQDFWIADCRYIAIPFAKE